jgi:hypothetical protein
MYPKSVYSPAALAHAVATISVALPGSPANAGRRLAVIVAACDVNAWSDATRAALARRATSWLALARWLGRSVRDLQQMDPVDLLDCLRQSSSRASEIHPSREPTDEQPVSVEPMTNVNLISTQPRQKHPLN